MSGGDQTSRNQRTGNDRNTAPDGGNGGSNATRGGNHSYSSTRLPQLLRDQHLTLDMWQQRGNTSGVAGSSLHRGSEERNSPTMRRSTTSSLGPNVSTPIEEPRSPRHTRPHLNGNLARHEGDFAGIGGRFDDTPHRTRRNSGERGGNSGSRTNGRSDSTRGNSSSDAQR